MVVTMGSLQQNILQKILTVVTSAPESTKKITLFSIYANGYKDTWFYFASIMDNYFSCLCKSVHRDLPYPSILFQNPSSRDQVSLYPKSLLLTLTSSITLLSRSGGFVWITWNEEGLPLKSVDFWPPKPTPDGFPADPLSLPNSSWDHID